MTEEKNVFLDSMHPKAAFTFGVVTGVAALSVLALIFILFSGTSFGDSSPKPKTAGTNPIAAVPTPVPSPAPLPPAGDPPPVTEDDHIRGDVNAPLTLIEYSDFECPFCKRFHPTMEQMMAEYGETGQVKWVYRHFPLGFHRPLAMKQAEAVECASELGGNDAFWELSDRIFEVTRSNGNGMQVSQLGDLAEEIGLNRASFQSCLDSGKYEAEIEAEMAAGSSAGVTGTPGSFLVDADGNAQLISGAVPYEQIRAAIEAALQ